MSDLSTLPRVQQMDSPRRRGRISRLSIDQCHILVELLRTNPVTYGYNASRWTYALIAQLIADQFNIIYNPYSLRRVLPAVRQVVLATLNTVVMHTKRVTLYHGDAATILATIPTGSVDCVVTSPPYYGQRDYGVEGQLGLEDHPDIYIERLVAVFDEIYRVLKQSGNLWVNIGDTYWSGKGRPHGTDPKQKHRRFLRPQDKTGPRPLCTPKQLLLIPHRFAIAMQQHGWIVRNDNVWYKQNPTPDPVRDRCASAHEYMFHFVKQRHYYFNYDAVAVPSQGEHSVKAPPSVWTIRSAPTFKKHCAVFPEELIRLPIMATLPPDGVLLDPFCGSATVLEFALHETRPRHVLGIDLSAAALTEAQTLLLRRHYGDERNESSIPSGS